jgi:dephospho-CoA kinase
MASTHSNPSVAQPDLASLKGVIPLVGLTGGIGSGKSTVSHLLGNLGAGVIDTDLIAHQITAPGGKAIPAIQKEFGSEYIDAQGALIRPKMRTLVFEDSKSRLFLEQITHPLIREETTKQAIALAQSDAPYLLFVVPLLIESGSWRNLVDYLTVVDCPIETQIARVMQRNNIPRQAVENILKAQASRQERLQAANAVIENQGDLASLELAVFNLHQKLLKIGNRPHSSS